MVRTYTATDWVFGIVVWLIGLFGLGLVIQTSGVFPDGITVGNVVVLLALGGVLSFFVLLFVRYFRTETGRLF